MDDDASRPGGDAVPGPAESVIARLSRSGTALSPVRLRDPDASGGPAESGRTDREGRYRILGEIARGGVGVVLKGRDVDLGREVALKVIRREHQGNPQVIERFVEEAQIGGQLQHPGIVPVYEIGVGKDQKPFFSMKLIRGRSFLEILAARKELGDDRRRHLQIFEAVCQAMAYAHSRGVIHRDLKPANVMVGAYGEVLVVDWGMGKVLDRGRKEAEGPEITSDESEAQVSTIRSGTAGSESIAGSVLGTPSYIPPEQARCAQGRVNERSDVFGLGAILCEVLTGAPPFPGHGLDALRAALGGKIDDAVVRLRECGSDPDLIAISLECLSVDPADRPADAGVVAERIGGYLTAVEERAQRAQVEAAESKARAAEEEARAERERASAERERAEAEQARKARRLTTMLAAAVLLLVLAGVLGWRYVEGQRRARAEEAIRQVSAAMEEAMGLRGRAETSDDLALFQQAAAAAKRAVDLAGRPGADPSLGERARSLSGELAAAAAAAKARHAQRKKDRAMIAKLDRIRSALADQFDTETAGKDYAGAFREYGIDVPAGSEKDAAHRIGASSIRMELVSAMDEWAWIVPIELHNRLLRILALADDDPWRNRVRRSDKRAELAELAKTADLSGPVGSLLLLATRLYQAGELDRAADFAIEVERHHPGDYWANFRAAQFSEARPVPNHTEAVRYYTAAIAIRPQAVIPRSNLAAILLHQGDAPSALAVLREAARVDPDDARTHSNIASCLMHMHDVDGALTELRKAVELDPGFADAHEEIGSILRGQKGDEKGALAEFREAVRLEPKRVRWHILLAESLTRVSDRKAARAELEAAKALGVTRPEDLSALGAALGALGDLTGAIEALRKATSLDPKTTGTWVNLANACGLKGDIEGAISAAKKAIELDPGDGRAHLVLGVALQKKRDLAGAEKELRTAIEKKPTLEKAHSTLAEVLFSLGKFEESESEARKAIDLNPEDESAYGSLAQALMAEEKSGEAIETMKKGLAAVPGSFMLHAELGEMYARAGKVKDGIAELRAAIRRKGDDARIHTSLGKLLARTGDDAGAVKEWQEAIRLDPDGSEPTVMLALHSLWKGTPDEAVRTIREAAEKHPKRPDFQSGLGLVLLRAGDVDGAIAALEAALKLDPGRYSALELLSRAFLSRGEPEKVLPFLDAAKDLDPMHASDRELLRGLAVSRLQLVMDADAYGDMAAGVAAFRNAVRLRPDNYGAWFNLSRALRFTGKLDEGLKAMKKGAEIAARGHTTAAPVEQWVAEAKAERDLAARLPDALAGKATDLSPADRVHLARIAGWKGDYVAAAHLLEKALAAKPDLARDDDGRIGFAAACLVARAAAEPAPEGTPVSAKDRARWRRDALVWLRAAFDVVKRLDPERQYPAIRLRFWLSHPDLAGIRDDTALKKFPAREAADLRAFWGEVRRTREQLTSSGK